MKRIIIEKENSEKVLMFFKIMETKKEDLKKRVFERTKALREELIKNFKK